MSAFREFLNEMKFTKKNGTYVATRKDGVVVTIEQSGYNEGNRTKWVCRYSDDEGGDNTSFAATKGELVKQEIFVNNQI
jgi:hypothetical protein